MENTIRINTIGNRLKEDFGEKVVKLSLQGGTTCPNRDGTKGVGGCVFCSGGGSGELTSSIDEQIQLLSEKWPNVGKYLAYFQSYTATYGPIEKLRKDFFQAIENPKINGIVISTRPDCLQSEVLSLLEEINGRTYMWIELGLQTIHGDQINRGYSLEVYDEAIKKLTARNIRVVTHLILGLPGESRQDIIDSVNYVCKPINPTSSSHLFGLKLHMLNIIKGSKLANTHPDYLPFQSLDEYVAFVCDLLEIIPPSITIHRLTGDVPRNLLISPPWSYKKRTILNGIAHELKSRNTKQGIKAPAF